MSGPAQPPRARRAPPALVALLAAALLDAALFGAAPAHAAGAPSGPPAVGGALAAARLEERPGAQVPLDTPLRDERGRRVRLGDLVRGERPTVLVLGYYGCPMLCGLVLERTAALLRDVEARGDAPAFAVLAVSIDPRDDAALARARQAQALAHVGWRDPTRWPFLTGAPGAVRGLAERVGWGYVWDARSGRFAHPAALVVLTPQGRVSSYLRGVSFEPDAFVAAVRAAAAGDTRASLHGALLRCFEYVPALRRWGDAIVWSLRGGALAVVAALALWLAWLWRRDLRRGA